MQTMASTHTSALPFGNDDPQHWPMIADTISYYTRVCRDTDGNLVPTLLGKSLQKGGDDACFVSLSHVTAALHTLCHVEPTSWVREQCEDARGRWWRRHSSHDGATMRHRLRG